MSFRFELDEREEIVADAIGEVGLKLQQALRQRKIDDGLTQNEIAEKLGVDRSRVNKCLSGFSNLTIKTLAELVWALDATLTVDIKLRAGKKLASTEGIHTAEKRNTVKSLRPINTSSSSKSTVGLSNQSPNKAVRMNAV